MQLPFGIGRDEESELRERQLDSLGSARQWLSAHHGEYVEAQRKLEDLEWLRDALATFRSVYESVSSYAPEDPPHAAVYRLGQAQVSMGSVFGQLAVLDEYERRSQLATEIQRQLGVGRATD